MKGRHPGLMKCLVMMKLTLLFLALSVVSLRGEIAAQTVFHDFRMNDATLLEVLNSIESKSEFTCLYSNDDVAQVKGLSLDFARATVEQILNECMAGTSLEYVIIDDTIIIRAASAKRVSAAQQTSRTVRGVVKGRDGAPVIGATVVLKSNTLVGTTTDIDGAFSITVPDRPDAVLVFSYIGMKTLEVSATGDSPLNVVMEENETRIDEVVVNGIFSREAATFTGSVVTMGKEELLRVGNQNVFQSLRNIDPSLIIMDNMEFGSDPNQTPKMQLRGTSSMPLDNTGAFDLKGTYGYDPNEPLFILDGFEATVEKIMDLDMNRIERLTILKDASAKAIYGSKAANGVVVIETKKTTEGEIRVSYTGTMDVTAPDLTSYNLVNAAQKLEVEREGGLFEPEPGLNYMSDKQRLDEKYNRILTAVLAGVDTDWLAKPLRTGIGTKHAVSIELGNNDLRFIGDFSYNNVAGVMKGSDRTTTSGTIMVSYRHKRFNFRNTLSVTSNVGNDSPYGTFDEYARMNPYWSPYDENGQLLQNIVFQFSENRENEPDFEPNPLYNASLNTLLRSEYIEVTNNAFVEWIILSNLKATARFGITEKRTGADEFYPSNHLKFRNLVDDDLFRRGSYQLNEGDSKTMTADLNVNWAETFAEKHVLFANAGFTIDENTYQENSFLGEGFPEGVMNNIIYARQFAKDSKPEGTESTIRNIGALAVASYSYDYRYLLDASYRLTGSSQFGRNNRWGHFWSVGAGWNIYNEEWMKGFEKLRLLKLRGSVGYTGAQGSDAYASLARYKHFLDKVYDNFYGASLLGMWNPDLKWQQKLDYNIGLDLNWGESIALKFDAYLSQTTNTVVDFTLPHTTGFGSVKENVGDVRNKGFDAFITYTPWRRAADRSSFSITGAISHNKNKITGISDAMREYNSRMDLILADRKENSRPVTKYAEGASMNAIWAVPSLGIDPATGLEMFRSRDGSITPAWNAADQVVCGDAMPKYSGNLGFNLNWKGLGLNLVFRYQWGGQYYNQTVVDLVEDANLNYNVDYRVFEGRWRNPGDVKPYTALNTRMRNEMIDGEYTGQQYLLKTQPTSRFVQDRNELSLGSINLSYDFFQHRFIERWGMERLRLNFYMNDVFTLSSIKMERGTSYPFARSFSFSLSATF